MLNSEFSIPAENRPYLYAAVARIRIKNWELSTDQILRYC